MIPVHHAGLDAFLVTTGPSWQSPVITRVAVPTRRHRSLMGRESRRARGQSLRFQIRWQATLQGRDAIHALTEAIRTVHDEPLLVPCWPLAMQGPSWHLAPWTAATLVAWSDDWQNYTLSSHPIADPSAWTWVAPVLRCRLGRHEIHLLTPDLAEIDFEVEEDSTAADAILLADAEWTDGPTLPDDHVPKVFPFAVDWSERVRAGAAAPEAQRIPLGDGRLSASIVYPQTGERIVEGSITVTSVLGAWELLRWWADQSAEAHFLASLAERARLAADAEEGGDTLQLAAPWAGAAPQWIALIDPDGHEIAAVDSVDGATFHLTAPLSRGWDRASAFIGVALLARHAADSLEISWIEPRVARAEVRWREVPPEYDPPSGEARGVTLGRVASRAWLYEVEVDWHGAGEIHRWTSWEGDVTAGGHTWAAIPIEHGEIRQTLSLDRDELTLRTRWDPAGPWRLWLPGTLDARVSLRILHSEVEGGVGSTPDQVWGGEITGVAFDGPIVSAKAAGANALFGRKTPRILMQPGCNHALFDPLCGLDRSAWQFGAEVVESDGHQVTLDSFSRTGGLPDPWGGEGYFALGIFERTAGGRPERASIWASSSKLDPGGGNYRITLTLGRIPPTPMPSGTSVLVWPGCDGLRDTCVSKFSNFQRFGGFPFIPDRLPQFTPERRSNSNIGKK